MKEYLAPNHSKAIELLEKFGTDEDFYRTVVWEIAKSNPEILVDAAQSKQFLLHDEVVLKDIIIRSSTKITAIKAVRDFTHWGLKEAKDYVDANGRIWVCL